jgi:hypothetical protein
MPRKEGKMRAAKAIMTVILVVAFAATTASVAYAGPKKAKKADAAKTAPQPQPEKKSAENDRAVKAEQPAFAKFLKFYNEHPNRLVMGYRLADTAVWVGFILLFINLNMLVMRLAKGESFLSVDSRKLRMTAGKVFLYTLASRYFVEVLRFKWGVVELFLPVILFDYLFWRRLRKSELLEAHAKGGIRGLWDVLMDKPLPPESAVADILGFVEDEDEEEEAAPTQAVGADSQDQLIQALMALTRQQQNGGTPPFAAWNLPVKGQVLCSVCHNPLQDVNRPCPTCSGKKPGGGGRFLD